MVPFRSILYGGLFWAHQCVYLTPKLFIAFPTSGAVLKVN